MKTRRKFGSIHDKSVRKAGLAPPRLFRVRNGIYLQPGGAVLVRRGNRPAADAIRRRRLPVPGVFAEEGGAIAGRHSAVGIVIACDKREAFAQGSAGDEAIHSSDCRAMDCFAEPVVGRAFARPVGSQ
jgi:hypothetical protein